MRRVTFARASFPISKACLASSVQVMAWDPALGLVSSWLQGWRRSAACGVKINQPQKLTELTVGGRKRKITDNLHFFLQRVDAITVDEVA